MVYSQILQVLSAPAVTAPHFLCCIYTPKYEAHAQGVKLVRCLRNTFGPAAPEVAGASPRQKLFLPLWLAADLSPSTFRQT